MRKNRLIALIGTLTMAAAGLAAVSAGVSSNKVEAVIGASSSVTNGNKRFNVFVKSNNSWVFNDGAKLFSSGLSDGKQNFDFDTADTDFGEECSYPGVRQMTIGSDTYYVATVSLGTSFSTTWWDTAVERHSGSNYWNKQNIHNESIWTSNYNSVEYWGDGIRNFGYYYKIALHTGLNLENVEYKLMNNEAKPSDPNSIAGYQFVGWYTNSALTTAWDSSKNFTGDLNLYAKYEAVTYRVHNYSTDAVFPMTTSDNNVYSANVAFTVGQTFKIEKLVGTTVNAWHGWETLSYGDGSARKNGQIVQDNTEDPNSNMKAAISSTFTIIYHKDWGDYKTQIDSKSFSITYLDKGGSEFSGVHESGYPTTHTYNTNEGILATVLDQPSKENSVFEGWYTNSDCTGSQVTSLGPTSYTSNITLYAKWKKVDTPVTMTFDVNGGKETINPIVALPGSSYAQPNNPTKDNNTFAGWDPSLPSVVPGTDTTYVAQWTLNPGVYLGGDVAGSWDMNGAINMVHNPDKADDVPEYVAYDVVIAANQEMKAYSENGYMDISTVSWSHPDYKCEIDTDNDNCKVLTAATYDVYYNTSTKNMHIHNKAVPTEGRYLVVNGDLSKGALLEMQETTGITGKEYVYSGSFAKDQIISAYYQDATIATEYYPELSESIKVWPYISDEGLKCPETGTYSIYLISEDGGSTYNKISIFMEGESGAEAFAKEFLSLMDEVCDLDGKESDLTTLTTNWSSAKDKFNLLDSNAQGMLRSATTSSENEYVAHFAESYDYIYSKYGAELSLNNFVNRQLNSSARHNMISINNVSTSTWIIAAVAVVGVVAVGVFFIYRKRKEN